MNTELTIEQLLKFKEGLERVIHAVVYSETRQYDMCSFTECVIGKNFGYRFQAITKVLFGETFLTDATSRTFNERPKLTVELNKLFACGVRTTYTFDFEMISSEEPVSKDDWLAEAGLVMVKLDQAIESKRHVEEI